VNMRISHSRARTQNIASMTWSRPPHFLLDGHIHMILKSGFWLVTSVQAHIPQHVIGLDDCNSNVNNRRSSLAMSDMGNKSNIKYPTLVL